jgi:hypothetical protein
MIVSNRVCAWASFAATDGCLLSAILVLASARALRKVGLIGPEGIQTTISWSQYPVQMGMRIWRREWATLRGRNTSH